MQRKGKEGTIRNNVTNNANTECHTYHGRNNYMQRKKQLGIKYCTVSQF